MACEAEVSGVFAEADQECFAPGGGVVDVIIVQVFHVFGLHFPHGGLGEDVTLSLGQVHHMHGSRCLMHLIENLESDRVRLTKDARADSDRAFWRFQKVRWISGGHATGSQHRWKSSAAPDPWRGEGESSARFRISRP